MTLSELRQRVVNRLRGMDVAHSAEAIDDAINMVQRIHIQPVSQVRKTAEYTTTEEDETISFDDLADDVYDIVFVLDKTKSDRGSPVPLLNEDNLYATGVRSVDDQLHLQGIAKNKTLEFHYDKRLTQLGEEPGRVSEPEIPETWHDLYWMGAVSQFIDALERRFRDALREFTREREASGKKRGYRIKPPPWR